MANDLSTPPQAGPSDCSAAMREEVEKAIAFQRRWRRITSALYFGGASMSVVSAIAATVIAGLGFSMGGAVAAAFATMFTSLEKVLLFREKWVHHRAIEVRLEILRIESLAGVLDGRGLSEKFAEVLSSYAVNLPVGGEMKGV